MLWLLLTEVLRGLSKLPLLPYPPGFCFLLQNTDIYNRLANSFCNGPDECLDFSFFTKTDCKPDLVCRLLFANPHSKMPYNFLILLTVCLKLNCVPCKRFTQVLRPQNMPLFGKRTTADVISKDAQNNMTFIRDGKMQYNRRQVTS